MVSIIQSIPVYSGHDLGLIHLSINDRKGIKGRLNLEEFSEIRESLRNISQQMRQNCF